MSPIHKTGYLQLAFGYRINWCYKRQGTISLRCARMNTLRLPTKSKTTFRYAEYTELNSHKYHPAIPDEFPTTHIHKDNISGRDVETNKAKTKLRKNIDVNAHHLSHHILLKNINLQQTPGIDKNRCNGQRNPTNRVPKAHEQFNLPCTQISETINIPILLIFRYQISYDRSPYSVTQSRTYVF